MTSTSSVRRRALAAAIRGPLPRGPLTRRALYERFRAGDDGLDHESALVLALAFGITSAERDQALSRALCSMKARDERWAMYRELRAAGVRAEPALRMARALTREED